MKELVFLPDRDGRDDIGDAAGFVRFGASAGDLAALASRLAVPQTQAAAAADVPAWRSALTLALLTDVWAGCGSRLTVMEITEETSPFASWVLSSRPENERGEPVRLLLLEREGKKRLLGVADARQGVKLPETLCTLADVAPERAAWLDRDTGEAADPVPFLTERDRLILLRRMKALALSAPCAEDYARALQQADAEEIEAVRGQDEAALERLAVRMEAVCGLTDFEAFSVREERYQAGGNALLRCLGCQEDALEADAGESRTYLWRGVPFARTSRALGLTGASHPDEAAALAEITDEVTIMSGSSVKWNYNTGAALRRWLDDQRLNAALLPQAKARLESSCSLLQENGRQVQTAVTLSWPWSASSGAVQALLQETLGDGWLEAAQNPFSDRLTKLTGHTLGDTALQTCCACADGVLLPPLSQAMAACVTREGMEGGLALDAMRFLPQEDGGITASFLLRGAGEVRLVRSYAPDEICVLKEAEAPCVAVWPCLPMADWKAYHVFVRGGVEVAALSGDAWKSVLPVFVEAPVTADMDEAEMAEPVLVPEAAWRCLHTQEYPGCLAILKDGLCLGALPNMLPACEVEKQDDVVIGIDLGSSQTAVAYAWEGQPTLMEGQQLTRMLVTPQEMPEDGFLGSLTPASVIPTAVALTGDGDELFTDGYAYRPDSVAELAVFDESLLRARLKWRSDADSVRARRILMHQVMLGAALTATLAGARSVAWRLTIADEMGDEGREETLEMANAVARQVAQETGLPLTQGAEVDWAEESAALCTCLRAEGAGRGSCVAMDFGSGSTKMHLWLLNQGRPSAGAVVFEGVQDVLLRFYRRQPVRLLEDLADCGDEKLLQDVLTIVNQMNPDLSGPRQADKLSLLLDLLLDTHRTAIGQHLNARAAANQPTLLQSILLETEAAALFCAGLMLAQAGDDTAHSHLLPDDMTICLTGRGAWLLDTFPPAARNALQRLTHSTMRLDHPVRFITLRAAARPVQSVALGLTVTRETGRVSDAPLIRTRESFSALMLRMMQQLCAAFPMHMWRLHEGLYDWQMGALTQAGEESIRRAAASCYDEDEDVAASVMAFVQTLRDTPILPDYMIDSGA